MIMGVTFVSIGRLCGEEGALVTPGFSAVLYHGIPAAFEKHKLGTTRVHPTI
jgi:hypothetical protein